MTSGSVAIALGLLLLAGRAHGAESCDFPHARTLRVNDGPRLAGALAEARPGDLILLAPGVYPGRFTAAAIGRADAPIVLCGPRAAVLDGGSVETGYGLHVTGSYWVFSGFTVTRSKKGIMLDGAVHNLLERLEIAQIGNEGIHFRAFSSDNVLRDSWVHDTGRTGSPHYGEGVYVGSAVTQWCEHSGCQPDRSDRNQILGNAIGPNTTAECIDVKEGTTGGVIRGNVLNGAGIVTPGGADAWVQVKGNGWLIEQNRGTAAPRDGFQVYLKAPGWGRDNVFRGNSADVRGPGLGFKIEGGPGNVVDCDNVVEHARRGMANVACARASHSDARGLEMRHATGRERP